MYLELLKCLVSQQSCSHFCGGTYGGVRSPLRGKKPTHWARSPLTVQETHSLGKKPTHLARSSLTGQATHSLGKKPPLGVCNIIMSLFEYMYISHDRYMYATTIIVLAYCMHLLLLYQFPWLLFICPRW